jgi:ribonuclease-3
LQWFKNRLAELSVADPVKDPKTQLQEYQQAQRLGLPKYEVIDLQGPTNDQVFTVTCDLPQLDSSLQARGSSRRNAEQEVARLLLTKLGVDHGERNND